MIHHLQLVLFLQFVEVSLQQACYTECLQDTGSSATSVNVLTMDSTADPDWQYSQLWYDRKTAEFNALYPAISVTLSYVQFDDLVTMAQQDLVQGTNLYQAYVSPFINSHGGTSRLSDHLMDMSVFTVDNVNNIEWSTIGRFFRSHGALYEKKVLTLPLAGEFVSLYYRRDLFSMFGMTVPRTLEEYVVASHMFNNTDLNGDGEPDYGSCFSHVGELSELYFVAWISQVLQYRGTSQGAVFDTDTLAPLLENPAVQEAVKLWKEVAGPPEMTSGMTYTDMAILWYTGRCAMTLGSSATYQAFQSPDLDEITGVARMPGSEKVWWREGNATAKCNTSFCRHATVYPDGVVVNHAPPGQTAIDGAINGQIDKNQQLAAFTYLTWLMSDANVLEAVVNPPSWPNGFQGTFVKPSLLVPSVWTPYGWRDPALSMFLSTATSNMDHPNAATPPRLPNSHGYYDVLKEISTAFWQGTGEFEDLAQDAGAVVVCARLTTGMEEVTDRGDREELIITYQKSLNIYVMEQPSSTEPQGDVIPTWAVHTIAGMLGFTACLASSFTLCWLISTVRQRRRLRARQRETWESIVDEAENYATTLGCPMALVSASHFLDFGCLTHFEAIRNAGKLRFLDTTEKIADFRRNFIVVFLSHRWLALTNPDPNSVHFESMCAAARRVSRIWNVSLDEVFLWVDFCSLPQEHLATRELYLATVPMYTLLCDMFIVIAPPSASDDLGSGISTHFRGGWCRAELLTRLVGSGLHNLFFCECCDGSLRQVTREMVHGIDLNVFSGDFHCCSLHHVGCTRCDREKLRTPMLGVYAQHLRRCLSEQGTTDRALTCVVQMEHDKARLLPRSFDFVRNCDDMSTSIKRRELFGPLPEILERRMLASRTKHASTTEQDTEALRSTTSVVEGASARSTRASNGLSQGRAAFDEGNLTDVDVLIQRELAAVTHTETALRIGASGMQDSAQELPSMNVGRHERGTGSSAGADRSSTDPLHHEESDGVVTDLDILIGAADVAIEQVMREAAHGPSKESTGSSTSTGLLTESDLI